MDNIFGSGNCISVSVNGIVVRFELIENDIQHIPCEVNLSLESLVILIGCVDGAEFRNQSAQSAVELVLKIASYIVAGSLFCYWEQKDNSQADDGYL